MIKSVLFDLGDTLIRPIGPWDPVMMHACRALSQSLCESGVEVPCESFAADFATALRAYYELREENLEEPTTFRLLRDLLTSRGLSADGTAIRTALDSLYTITRSNWRVAEDALAVAQALRGKGVHLGVLSNAGDDEDVQQLVRETGLSPFLDFVITSAKVGYRKPDARIFAEALSRWDFPPRLVLMVGDRLEADIRGAKESGLRAVWLTANPVALKPEGPQPDAMIERLSELPNRLRQL